MRRPLQTNETGRVGGQAQAAPAAARVADKRAAERRASCSQMWPSPMSLPQAALGPGQLSQQPLATSVPAYEPSHHNSLSSSSLGSGNGLWQYPHPSDAKLESKMAGLWPRRASETLSSSSWLDDYYNSAVAEFNDRDDEEDSVFFPRQKNHQQQNTQNDFVQPPPWLPAVLDDTTATPPPRPPTTRQSRLSYPSSSFHYLAAQQKAAQIMLQNERVLRGRTHSAEQLAMYQYQQQYQLQQQQQQLQQQCANFSSDMIPELYPKGQQLHTGAITGREDFHTVTPSAMAAMEAMAALSIADPSSRRTALAQKDGNSLFSSTFQFQDPSPILPHGGQQQQQQNQPPTPPPTATVPAPTKTFKPMQMVFREGRRASASSTSTSTSNSSGTGTGTATTATTAVTTDTAFSDAMLHQQTTTTAAAAAQRASSSSASQYPQFCLPLFSSPSPSSLATLALLDGGTASLPLEEQAFRRQQGISLNYRGDIHNPHNRGDHIPTHLNTSLFLMGLPPQATVGDLLRAVTALGPTGRVFAASINPPDPARRLPLAAAKISFFTRQQAERLKAQIDAQQLVMFDAPHPAVAAASPKVGVTTPGRPLTIRCAWNRDKKPPRQCVQASECRVLRIRGPADVVNFEALTAYFDEKFRYELQDVRVVSGVSGSYNGSSGNSNSSRHSVGSGVGEQTMEWRFASFQSQAIAAKMALNQERKMVRVEYGRDPCEWGGC